MSIYFLSAQGLRYLAEVNDDIYSVHQKYGRTFTTMKNGTANIMEVYSADEPVAVIGCKTQYQLCRPTKSQERQCTPLGSFRDLYLKYMNSTFVEKDWPWELSLRFWNQYTSLQPLMVSYVNGLGSKVLLSHTYLYSGLSDALPDNQWQLDVEGWFRMIMVSYQLSPVRAVIGQWGSRSKTLFDPPTTKWGKFLCKNQVRKHFVRSLSFGTS